MPRGPSQRPAGRRCLPGDAAASPVVIDLTECTDQEGSGEEQPSDVLATIDGNQITERHREILLCDHEWLNDEIVNSFCARISQRVPDIHCCSSFFFAKLSAGLDGNLAWLERWRRSTDAMRRRLIFIPVNWGNSHWALLVYSVQEDTLRYYDSMMSASRGREALGRVQRAFGAIRLGRAPARSKDGEPVGVLAFIMSKMSLSPPPGHCDSPPPGAGEVVIKTETPRGQPQQTDGSSCGVYLCWWVERLAGPESPAAEGLANVAAYRRHILETLLGQR